MEEHYERYMDQEAEYVRENQDSLDLIVNSGSSS